MALWTLGACMSEATQLLGSRSDIPVSRASLYANQAALDIHFAVDPQEMEGLAISSTTSGENKITLPPDFYAPLNLSNISMNPPQTLDLWNSQDVDSSWTYLGPPVRFSLYNTYLQLWPSPDSSYSLQLRYQTRPSVLTITTSVPSFDTRFGMAWVYRTAELLADSYVDYEKSAIMRQKYLATISTVPSDGALRQRNREGMRVSMPHAVRGNTWIDSLTSLP